MPTPLPVLPSTYLGYVYGTYLGKRTGCTFAWTATPAPTDITQDAAYAQEIATSMAGRWAADIAPRMPLAYVGVTARVYALGHASIPAQFAFNAASGGASGDVAPVSTAAVVRYNVFRRGRGSQSHSAISPIPKDQVTADGTSLTNIAQTGLLGDITSFLAGVPSDFAAVFSGATLRHVQLSKKGAGATYSITATAVEGLLGTERSRTSRP